MLILDGVDSLSVFFFSFSGNWKKLKLVVSKIKLTEKVQPRPESTFLPKNKTSCMMMAWTIATILRHNISNIVSRTVHNVVFSVARPELSRLWAIWNLYRKSDLGDSTQKKKSSGTRSVILTQDIVGYPGRVNWYLGSFNTAIYRTWGKRVSSNEDHRTMLYRHPMCRLFCRFRRGLGYITRRNVAPRD